MPTSRGMEPTAFERPHGLLRGEGVDDAESVLAVAGAMHEEPVERQIGGRVDAGTCHR